MTRGLIIIKAGNYNEAVTLAQEEPFNLSPEAAAKIFVPANAEIDADGEIVSPATLYWAAGLFDASHWAAMQLLADALPWAHVSEYSILSQPNYPKSKLAEIEGQESFSIKHTP